MSAAAERWCHFGTKIGTIDNMALNLRLRPEVEAALRAEAERSGRSQQDLLREAVDRYLGLAGEPAQEWDHLISSGKVLPPRGAYRKVIPTRKLPDGQSTADLLDREDRF
ncbi:ribbon-helix-helix protein, CopG family [Saccharopolyspora erythraea]|uniref:ribbon-helix-helix domain-containing protein n=1 Tax=Saccharopolyspora erythraea TaxID=1836 RepID=UPI001BACE504|nr:CopG family transcriptional regulator [Saccharopolyspora erythraea]QUH01067.1 ribbon-helix-helix protein, CopG family [Saccharopolyspora erythraea]